MIMYSPSARGWYHAVESSDIPGDARGVSVGRYAELMKQVESGGEIVPDTNGDPVYVLPAQLPPTVEQVQRLRLGAYREEADGLRAAAEYDAMIAGAEPDYTAWLAKVAEIKGRYPLPE